MPSETLNILMVEDNAGQARLMGQALQSAGITFELEHVTDLAGALAHVAAKPPDLVLLDLGLPDSFGIDTVRRMHEAAPDLPIIVLTALSDEEVAIEAVREGAQDYLDKSQLSGRMLGRVIRYAVERTRAEREIVQANERFRLAASAAHEIIYDWDLNEQTVFRSEGLTRVLGITPQEAGNTRQWWIDRMHPEDAPKVSAILDAAFKAENAFTAEYRVRHLQGHYVHVWDRGMIVRDARGRPVRVVGGYLDVSERIHAEEEIRRTNETLGALIKGSPLAIITLDRDGRVMTWNPAAEEIFGWKERDVLGRELPTIPEAGRAEYRRLMNRDLQGRSRRSYEIKRVRKDRTIIDVSISTAPIRDRAGHVVAVMSILEDITQRKRSEEERARLQEQLHQTQKLEAVGQLAAGVAHDFNNLLTVILGNVDRMNKLLTDQDERRAVLTMIEEAARQATGVTRSLLTFSHRIPSAKSQTNLSAAVEESARLLQRLLPATIELGVELPENDPLWVVADRSQLQQVIINLAINARDAMPQGGRIRIRLSRIHLPKGPRTSNGNAGQFARLEVSDSGAGISPEVLPHIFEPFFTTKSRGKGTGLGLAIVRSIVQDHDAQLDVETHPGEGSTFTVTLPAAASETPPEMPQSPEVPRGHGELLLLAEDSAYVREVIASALRSFGYQVIEAPDGAIALEQHEKMRGEFAAFVFDHEMPKRTGLLCIQEIRRRGDDRPAILTSGSFGTDLEEQLGENTILLRKPFQMKELARVLASVLKAQEPST